MKHILLTIIFLLCCWLPVKCEDTGASVAEAVWAEMLAFTPTVKAPGETIVEIDGYPVDAYCVDDNMKNYWRQISDACSQSFLKGFRKAKDINQIDQFAKKYVGFFGTKDATSDMRWALGCPLLAANSYNMLIGLRNRHTAEFKALALSFNKYVVENALTNKVYYKRIHWFTLWASEFPFIRKVESDTSHLMVYIKEIQDLKAKEKWDETCFEYWFDIRLQLSVGWLCNLEDQLMVLNPPITEDKMKKLAENGKNKWGVLFTTYVCFDPKNLKYEIRSEKSLPPIILPKEPFPNTPFFKLGDGLKTIQLFPRISPDLMHVFVEDYIRHIIKR